MAAAPLPFGLRVCPALDAPHLAAGWATHVLSITDPGRPEPPLLAPRHLALAFEDTERADHPHGPAAAHVRTALAFTAGLASGDRLLVHCVAGISRSTALAIAVLVQHRLPADQALAAVAEMRPDLWPNERLCRLADAHLETGGAIMRAARVWQRNMTA